MKQTLSITPMDLPLKYTIKSGVSLKTVPTVLHLNSTVVITDVDKATLFNQYFHSVFTTSSTTYLT